MSLQELIDQVKRKNELLKLKNTLMLMDSMSIPRSKFWQWFAVQNAPPGSAAIKISLAPGASAILVDTNHLPSGFGYLNKYDFLSDSDLIEILLEYSSGGQSFKIGGTIQSFWGVDFSPRIFASAGDPIVVEQTLDEPAGATLVNVSVRTSTSSNILFNTPFKLTVINTDTVTRNVLSYNFYFLMMRREFEKLMNESEEQDLIWGKEIESPV